MPSFQPEDIEIDVYEFFDSCSKKEKIDLIEYIEEYKEEHPLLIPSSKYNLNDIIFNSHIDKLRGKYPNITKEDEAIIIAIANKYDF